MNMKKTVWILAVLALASGCAVDAKRVFIEQNAVGRIDEETLDLMLFEHQLGPNDNMSSTIIRKYENSSVHLVQIRGSEKPHRHDYHDSVVFFEAGQGILHLGKNVVHVQKGCTVFIEHGTPHYFVNEGPDPAVAIVVFSPPYDGQDNVPVAAPQ